MNSLLLNTTINHNTAPQSPFIAKGVPMRTCHHRSLEGACDLDQDCRGHVR